MKLTPGLAVAGAAALALVGLAAPTASAASPAHHTTGAAVFVQSDDPAHNTVVAYRRASDGSLRRVSTYRTGGRGGVLDGSVVDHLASQGGLTLDASRHHLYAVNAGSDTITVFDVHGDRLQRRQIIGSGGDFPVSVTASGRLVYVLNARDGGSIQGYVWAGGRLRRMPAWHRELGLDPTATPEFTHTPGQVLFAPSGRQVLVTTKAGANSIEAFSLDRTGAPAASPVVNDLPGTVPFAAAFDRHGDLAVVEAGTNAVASFRLGGNGRLHPLSSQPTGQAATCWISVTGNRVYVSNAGSASVSGYVDQVFRLRPLGNAAASAGTVDSAISSDGRFLYVQGGAAGTLDTFRIHADGSLSKIGTLTVPNAVGGEGIAAS